MAVGFTQIDKLLLELEIKDKKAMSQFKNIDKVIEDIDKQIKDANKGVNKFEQGFKKLQGAMLGTGLSFLFTGMAIARFFKTMLQSLFSTFLLVEGESSVVNDTIGELQARLAFLKFLLGEAFVESGLFDKWVDRVEKLINLFSSLDEDTQATLVDLAIWGFIFGTALMVVGQAILGILGPITLLSFIMNNGLLPAFIALAIIILAMVAVWRVMESDMDPVVKLLVIIAILLFAIIAVAAIFGIAISLPFIIVAAVIAVVIAAIILMADHVGGLKNAFLAFGIFVLAIFAAIGDAIIEAILAPLRNIVFLINAAISASNRFLGTDFSTIELPESFNLSRKVFQMRNDLLAKGTSQEGAPASSGGGVTNIFNIEGFVGDKTNLADFIGNQIDDKINFSEGSNQK